MTETIVMFATLPAGLWEMLFGWFPSTPDQCATSACQIPKRGFLFYIFTGAAVGILAAVFLHYAYHERGFGESLATLKERFSEDETESETEDAPAEDEEDGDEREASYEVEELPANIEVDGPEPADTDDSSDDEENEDIPETDLLDEVDELHQQLVEPSSVEPEFRQIGTGTQHRQVMFAKKWPDQLPDGLLRQVFTKPDLQFDFAMHIKPRDRQRAQREAESRTEALEADADIFGGSESGGGGQFTAGDKQEEARRTANVRDAIKNGERPFDVSLYVSPRAETKDELRSQVEKTRKAFADAPANVELRTVAGEQDRAFQSILPLGEDVLAEETTWSPDRLMLGTGVGATLTSATKSTLLEETGVELGEHAFNGSPLIKDPFKSETNYNWVVIGDSGSGKSYDTKLQTLRTVAKKEDTMVILLDPLKGFVGLAEALDAQPITIGGDRGLNPLEIRKPPEHIHQMDDEDPLSAKIKDVMSFFENFAHHQGLELGGARTQLQSAVKEAYSRQDITHDPATHGRESPTVADVLDVLEEMADDPEEFVVRTDEEADTIKQHATTLIGYLRPFVDGEYENLARQSEFDLRDEDFVYLDLSQQEASGDGSGLMMQLVFSLVYERAKETTKNVVFVIDEARFLMREAKSLEFLGQRVRHSRHFDTSIRFITQNVRDFFGHEEAESIINNSFIKVLHRTEEIEEWADTFGLNEQQVQFVESARTGDGGYSEALIEIDGDWYPVQVFATPAENAVVDYDETENEPADLPGIGGGRDPIVQEIEDRLHLSILQSRLEDGEIYTEDIEDEELAGSWADSPESREALLDLLNPSELEQALEEIANGRDAKTVVEEVVAAKLADVESTLPAEQWSAITTDVSTTSDHERPEDETDGGEDEAESSSESPDADEATAD